MSKVVYRGVEYDTDHRRQQQSQQQQEPQQYNETYRGVKYRPCKNNEAPTN